jgi:sugar phosphate isomerase/epimerase
MTSLGLGQRLSPAAPPFQRTAPPRLLLSLAAYSFRDYLPQADNPRSQNTNPNQRIDLFGFMDFCAAHGCHGTELTSYYFPKNPTHDFLLQIRRYAFLKGLAISGTAVGNTFTHPAGEQREAQIALVKSWIERARIMTAPHIRVFAGDVPPGLTNEQAKKNCIAALEECAEEAGRAGIFLGLENHGGIVADPAGLLDIVQSVRSPWVGINLDTGNFHTEDPYTDVASCLPYAVNVQIKSEIKPRGQSAQLADLPRLVHLLRQANYQGFVALEYEAAESPWSAVPRLLKELKDLMS